MGVKQAERLEQSIHQLANSIHSLMAFAYIPIFLLPHPSAS